MISEIKQSRHTGGRPKKVVKREVITGVRFIKPEYYIGKHKAVRAGSLRLANVKRGFANLFANRLI